MTDPTPTASLQERRTDVDTIRRTVLARLLAPSMPLRMAYCAVLWVVLLVVVALLWGDPGCAGKGAVP